MSGSSELGNEVEGSALSRQILFLQMVMRIMFVNGDV
jgi:hypothetical protein